MAKKRKHISKKIRFEVFKRDSFKCQYCGASAPETILVIDHIEPVSKDGADDIMNYITACQPCNAGKGDRLLDDNAAIQKQKAQLDALSERREQLEMLLQWRKGLQGITEAQIDAVLEAWANVAVGWRLNDGGISAARKMLKKHGLQPVLDAIDRASEYIEMDESGKATKESVSASWAKVGAFLHVQSMPEEKQRLYYVRGILRKRLRYIPPDTIKHLNGALKSGLSVEDMEDEARVCRNWTNFKTWIEAADGAQNG